MNTINIYFTSFKKPLNQSLYSAYLEALSPALKQKNVRYVRWQNRHSHLFGKLLLMKALKEYGFKKSIWEYIEYNEYCRPSLTIGDIDFNISHSGDYVVCAIGKNVRLGIDIEENIIRRVENFRAIFSDNQWDEVNNAKYSLKTLYKYWTIKESVIKADGRGFAIPLEELKVESNLVQYDDKQWFVQELEFAKSYSAALATNKASLVNIQGIDFYKTIPPK